MAWSGLFTYGGTEVLNASRVEAYAKNFNLSWFKPIYNETTLAWLIGDQPYSSPLQDDAPWTDPGILNSYDFYGVYPLEITGFEDSTVTAEVVESVVDGGYIGRVRRATRPMVFNTVLVGASECAVEYGMRWLRAVLNGGPCFGQVYGTCGGADLCYLACTPVVGETEPTYSPGPLALDDINMAANPNAELNSNGWYTNDPSKWAMEAETVAPISGSRSFRVQRIEQNYVTGGANGTFEGGVITGFVGSGGAGSEATVAASTAQAHGGTGSLRVTFGTGSAQASAAYYQATGLNIGTEYTVECWMYVPAASIGTKPVIQIDSAPIQGAPVPVTTPDAWVKTSRAFTAAATSHYIYVPITTGASTAGMLCYVDDVRVLVGSAVARSNVLPSPYETAPVGQDGVRFTPYQTATGSATIKTAADVNEALNPSIAAVTGGWSSNNASLYPATLDTTAPISAPGSFMTTRSATSPSTVVGSIYASGTNITGTTQFPASSGIPVTWSLDVKVEQASRQARLDIQWRDAAGTQITPTANGNLVALGAPGTVTRVSMTATPPAGTAFCYGSIQVITVSGNALDGERAWFDNLMISYTGQTVYFDGSTPGCSWEGTPNASRSFRAITRSQRPALRVQATGTSWPAQPNLCTAGANGTFEGGVLTGWLAFGGTGNAIAAEPTIKHSGSHSLKTTWAANATQTGAIISPVLSGLTIGQAYVIEGWAYVPTGSAVTPQLRVTGTQTSVTVAGAMAVKDTWTKVTQSFVPAATTAQFAFYSMAPTVGGEVAYLDDVKLYAQQNLCVQGENGTFELASVSGWAGIGAAPPTLASVTAQKRTGSYSMRITWATAGSYEAGAQTTTALTTVIGQQYTAEAWLYIPTGSAQASLVVAEGAFAGNIVTVKDQWALSTVTFTATATTTYVAVSNRADTTAGQLCYVDDVQFIKTTNTQRLGMRSYNTTNVPVGLTAGVKFLVGVDVFVPTGTIQPSSIGCILRDDVNNDSAAATFDASTPATQTYSAGSMGTWVRYQWLATVNAGRTVTGVYVAPNTLSWYAAGQYVDYGPVLVQPQGALGAPYFDGSTPDLPDWDYAWNGPVGNSVSEQRSLLTSGAVASTYYTLDPSTPFPASPGEEVTFAIDVKVEKANRSAYFYLNFLDGASNGTGLVDGPMVPLTPGVVTRVVRTAIVPPGSAKVYPVVSIEQTVVDGHYGEKSWFDNLYFGADPSGDYYDGSTTAKGKYSYLWRGNPNASLSERYFETSVQDPEPTAEDCYRQVGRSMHAVTTTLGPTVTAKMTMQDGGAAWSVTWTMVAANPAEFGSEYPLIQGFLDPAVEMPYVGGLPPGATFDPDGFVQDDELCPVPAFQPVYDPTCNLLSPPPDVPTVVPMCFNFPVNYVRRNFTIPDELIPLWMEVVPVISLHTGSTEARSVRLRFYADTFGTGSPDADPCNFCGDVVFSYIPPHSTLVMDGTDRIAYIDSPGMPRRRADSLVSDSDGNPFEWPQLSCGFGYVVTVDTPQQGAKPPAIDLSLVPRAI